MKRLSILSLLTIALVSCGGSESTPNPAKATLKVIPPKYGKISSSPVGIECSATNTKCEADFNKGTAVTLTISRDEDTKVISWQNDCITTEINSSDKCQLAMDADKIAAISIYRINTPSYLLYDTTVTLNRSEIVSTSFANEELKIKINSNSETRKIQGGGEVFIKGGFADFPYDFAAHVNSAIDNGNFIDLILSAPDIGNAFSELSVPFRSQMTTPQNLKPQSLTNFKCEAKLGSADSIKMTLKNPEIDWKNPTIDGRYDAVPFYKKGVFNINWLDAMAISTSLRFVADPIIKIPIPEIEKNLGIGGKYTCKFDQPFAATIAATQIPYTGIMIGGSMLLDPSFTFSISSDLLNFSMKDGYIEVKPHVNMEFKNVIYRKQGLNPVDKWFNDKNYKEIVNNNRNAEFNLYPPKLYFNAGAGVEGKVEIEVPVRAAVSSYWLTRTALGAIDLDFATISAQASLPFSYYPLAFDKFSAKPTQSSVRMQASGEISLKSEAVQGVLDALVKKIPLVKLKGVNFPSAKLIEWSFIDEGTPSIGDTKVNGAQDGSAHVNSEITLSTILTWNRNASALYAPTLVRNLVYPSESYYLLCPVAPKVNRDVCLKINAQLSSINNGFANSFQAKWTPKIGEEGTYYVIPEYVIPLLPLPMNTLKDTSIGTITVLPAPASISVTLSTPSLTTVADNNTFTDSVTATVTGTDKTGVTWTAYTLGGTVPAPAGVITFYPSNTANTIKVKSTTAGWYVLKAVANADKTKVATVNLNVDAVSTPYSLSTTSASVNPPSLPQNSGPLTVTATVKNSGTQSFKGLLAVAMDVNKNGSYLPIFEVHDLAATPLAAQQSVTKQFTQPKISSPPNTYALNLYYADSAVDRTNAATADWKLLGKVSDLVVEAPVTQSPNPIAHYTFDDCANLGKDAVGNHDGLVEGAVTCVPDGKNNAVKFSGGWIRIPNSPDFNLGAGVSYSMWVKPTQVGGPYAPLAKSGDQRGFNLQLSSDATQGCTAWMQSFEMKNASDYIGNFKTATPFKCNNEWVHLLLAFNAKSAKIYANGILAGSLDKAVFDKSSMDSRDVYLGVSNEGSWYPLTGLMDEVKVFNRVITPAEVSTLATESVKTPIAQSGVLFSDDFNGSTLDMTKWEVKAAGATVEAQRPISSYQLSGGKLVIDVTGGGNGFMGTGDGAIFIPKNVDTSSDFTIYASGEELSRVAKTGIKDNSGFGISLNSGAIGIGIYGNYSGYFDGYDYNQYQGHRINIGCEGKQIEFLKLGLDTLYAVELRIRRQANNLFVGYKMSGNSIWTERQCGTVTGSPTINFGAWSGDGGNTSQNGAFKGAIDRFEITSP